MPFKFRGAHPPPPGFVVHPLIHIPARGLPPQAYEGLRTADRLREEYLFLPARVKEVYLHHLLTEVLPARKVRSAIIFSSTCRGCNLLSLLMEELGLPAAALHSGRSVGRWVM